MNFVFHVGGSDFYYDMFNNISALAFFLLSLLQIKKRKTILSPMFQKALGKPHRTKLFSRPEFYAFLETLIIVLFVMPAGVFVNQMWATIITKNAANYFGSLYFLPPLMFLWLALWKFSPLKQLDLWAPCIAIQLFFAKIACFLTGCCYGKELSGGFYYSNLRNRYEIPVQMIEAVVALMIFVILLVYNKKKKTTGTTYPLFILLYSSMRFITEFIRDDFPEIFFGMSIYHIQCLIGIVYGIFLLIFVVKFASNKRIFTEGFSFRFKK